MTEAQRVFYQEAVGQLAEMRRAEAGGQGSGVRGQAKPRRLKGEAWAAMAEKAAKE